MGLLYLYTFILLCNIFSLFVIIVRQSTKAPTQTSMYIFHVLSSDVVLYRLAIYFISHLVARSDWSI